MDEQYLKIRIRMMRAGITFDMIAKDHGVTRQRVQQLAKAGYPQEGRPKEILDDLYSRISKQ